MIIEKSTLKFFEDYFWVIGIALLIGGILLIFTDALAILISGVIFLIIGAILKGVKLKNKNSYQGTIISKEGKEIGYIVKDPKKFIKLL